MADTYRYIGRHPDHLEDGRPLAPGQGLPKGAVDLTKPKDKQLVDDGLIIDIPAAKRARKEDDK